MRFAIAAFDRYHGIFEALTFAGWQTVKLFTMPAINELDNNKLVVAMAEKHKAAIQLSRMTEQDLWNLRDQGCEALIVASYSWKVPDWEPYLKYAINFHPSPLPEGRGPYPVFQAIREGRKHWAMTCHKISPEFDRGDILAAENFALSPEETHEGLDFKLQMAGKKLALKITRNLEDYWQHAVPQTEGSYWKKTEVKDRIVNFSLPVEEVLRHIRAYGCTDSLAFVNKCWVVVKRAVGWAEAHNVPYGTVAHIQNNSIIVAVKDGYVALQDVDFVEKSIADALKAG